MKKHKWSDPERTQFLTTRTCVDCGMQRITHHEGGLPWIDFKIDESTIPGPKVPPCNVPAKEAVSK